MSLKELTWNEARQDGVLPTEWLDLGGANLHGANLHGANLSGADLSWADLRWADLSGANLHGANLSGANLSGAYLRGANLGGANLHGADLSGANLSGAKLHVADLSMTYLSGADLSGCKGLLSAADWLRDNFKANERGLIVYKRIGKTTYNAPKKWEIKAGKTLAEVRNPNRTEECGCGVNFGTRKWCEKNYQEADLWECLIEWIDLAGVIVPYNTDGKARCERLTLIRKVEL